MCDLVTRTDAYLECDVSEEFPGTDRELEVQVTGVNYIFYHDFIVVKRTFIHKHI